MKLDVKKTAAAVAASATVASAAVAGKKIKKKKFVKPLTFLWYCGIMLKD